MISRYGDDIVFPKDFYYVNSFTKVRIIYKNREIVRDPHTFLKTTLFSKKVEKEIETDVKPFEFAHLDEGFDISDDISDEIDIKSKLDKLTPVDDNKLIGEDDVQ